MDNDFTVIFICSIIVSLAQIPGLTIEGILGMVLFYVMAFAFERGKAFHTQQQ